MLGPVIEFRLFKHTINLNDIIILPQYEHLLLLALEDPVVIVGQFNYHQWPRHRTKVVASFISQVLQRTIFKKKLIYKVAFMLGKEIICLHWH